jgi:hypothetical protein
MTYSKPVGTLVFAAAGLLLAAVPASAGHHCVRAGGSATAVTSELATTLAKESLYQSNLWAGRKGRGHISVSCKYLGVLTKCTARQVACK